MSLKDRPKEYVLICKALWVPMLLVSLFIMGAAEYKNKTKGVPTVAQRVKNLVLPQLWHSCGSDLVPGLGTFTCHQGGPPKKRVKKERKKEEKKRKKKRKE